MTPERVEVPSKVTVLSASSVMAPVYSASPPEKAAVAPNWIGLAKVWAAVPLTNAPPARTRVAAPRVPSAARVSVPALTVTELAAVKAETSRRVRLRSPVLTKEPAPARPFAKFTSVFGRSRVRVLPAVTAARPAETSMLAPSKRIAASPPMTSDLNGVAEAMPSARTRVPWSSWKVPANLPAGASRRPRVRAPAPVFTTFAVSS